MKIGVQIHPQGTTTDAMRTAWQNADAMGVDSLWVWDHFYPLYGDADAAHFECYSLLAAMAVTTSHATIGALVTCNSYRNPQLLADMSRTIDHLSNGRFILGIGSGWFERDYNEYGYEFGTAPGRLKALAREKVTLRLVARHATVWNGFGTPEELKAKNAIIDEWCKVEGTNPKGIERTTLAMGAFDIDAMAAAGIDHVIMALGTPFDLSAVESVLAKVR
jgi:Luciferase-like monooxygenase